MLPLKGQKRGVHPVWWPELRTALQSSFFSQFIALLTATFILITGSVFKSTFISHFAEFFFQQRAALFG